MRHRPRILISRCLLGEAVRYDGGHRHAPSLVAALRREAELVPICPEVEAGLGVPRPPIRLLRCGGAIRVVEVGAPGVEVSQPLQQAIRAALGSAGALHGVVLKARSPSCGAGSVPRFDEAGEESDRGDGLLAGALRSAFPGLPVREEEALETPAAIAAFLDEVRSYFGR